MHISTLSDCHTLFQKLNKKVYGIGVTAFMRIGPAFFLKDNFEIICYKESIDLDVLRTAAKIFPLEHALGNQQLEKMNTLHILQHPTTIHHLQQDPGSYLFVYKNSEGVETIAKKLGYQVINTIPKYRDIFENKKHFRTILQKIGISPILGENISLAAFVKKEYQYFQKKYGNHLVLQLPDIKTGGGLGTFFVKNRKEFDAFVSKIASGRHRNTIIFSLNITQFIDGISSSIIGCTTQHGTFSSSIQTQLLDIPEVINLKKGAGLFCGHDRSSKHFSPALQQQASQIVQTLGAYMYTHKYKGIFGLDLIVDEKQQKIYVVECNPRYTGAFPMISLLDIKHGIIPMDVFHILEYMEINYTLDFDAIDKKYKWNKEGSHIILCNTKGEEAVCKKDMLPGVYSYTKGELLYQRPGIGYADITKDNEFIIIDGNPKKGDIIKSSSELSRFCHLLFPKKISLNQNTLNVQTRKIITCIYTTFIS